MNSIKYILGALFVLLMLSLTSCAQQIPQAIVFEDINMTGSHTHLFMSSPDLGTSDKFWNDKISSLVILYGTWTFYENAVGDTSGSNKYVTLNPGIYPDITKEGLGDNSISRVQLASQ